MLSIHCLSFNYTFMCLTISFNIDNVMDTLETHSRLIGVIPSNGDVNALYALMYNLVCAIGQQWPLLSGWVVEKDDP